LNKLYNKLCDFAGSPSHKYATAKANEHCKQDIPVLIEKLLEIAVQYDLSCF